jgi:hypothetical protein
MPDDEAQVPTPDELIGKGIDKLVELRPSALPHVNNGRGVYANIFAGWRAQAALVLRRDADLAKQGRLKHGSGGPLLFLAGSEFDTPAVLTATKAVGQVVLSRAAGRPGGTIRKGARFSRPADTSSQRLYREAQAEVAVDVHVGQGDTQIVVPLVAAREGILANRPRTATPATELEIADDIHDRSAWTVESYEMGGGADAVSDDDLKRYARAFASGQHGPNARAALAGVLKSGARHAIAIDDPARAALVCFVADQSWAGSTRWSRLVRQSLYDGKHVGFGCKVLIELVTNELIGVEVVCRVRRTEYLAETTSLDGAVQKALRSYFDDRPDWNRWKTAALRGVVARADRRLLSCPSVVVKRLDGTILTEPVEGSTTHFMLLDNSVRATYLPPS